MRRLTLVLLGSLAIFSMMSAAALGQQTRSTNDAETMAQLQASCLASIEGAAYSQSEKNQFCSCLLIAVFASGVNALEIEALIVRDFMDELTRLHNSRPGGWNSAINACFN